MTVLNGVTWVGAARRKEASDAGRLATWMYWSPVMTVLFCSKFSHDCLIFLHVQS